MLAVLKSMNTEKCLSDIFFRYCWTFEFERFATVKSGDKSPLSAPKIQLKKMCNKAVNLLSEQKIERYIRNTVIFARQLLVLGGSIWYSPHRSGCYCDCCMVVKGGRRRTINQVIIGLFRWRFDQSVTKKFFRCRRQHIACEQRDSSS